MAGLLSISEPTAVNDKADDNDGFVSATAAPSAKTAADLATDATKNQARLSVQKHSRAEIAELFDLPFMDLLLQAQSVHRENFPANEVQIN